MVIDKVVDYFKEKPVTLVYLFGSYAKGTPSSESDVDIAVMTDSNFEIDLWKWRTDLVMILGKEVDLIDLKTANIILKKQIVQSGNCIMGDESLAVDFKYQTIVNYAQYLDDVSPVKNMIKQRGFVWKGER